MAPRIAYRQPQAGGLGFARTRKVIGGAANIAAASTAPQAANDLLLNAQTALFKIPKDFVVTGWFGPAIPKLDSGAALTFSIGDNGNALQAANTARFLSASAVGQAGGALPAIAAGVLFFQYLADTDVLMTITAAAAGQAAAPGPVTIYVEGFLAP
jgi:hypothetical protein